MNKDEEYMYRCIQLAKLAAGEVAPNPMVGAVLVYEDRIIGEGYHKKYGEAHAEVNCIASVKKEDEPLISGSALYVSLEPCAHFGKTPPCADLVIHKSIPKVVIGCRDPFPQVDGKGIEKLKQAGIEVITNVLEPECLELNKRFFTFHNYGRPYIILKWAQSKNQRIASESASRVLISNEITNRLVHKWRAEETAIMAGTNTALHDDPALNVRHSKRANPVRLIPDMKLRLPSTLNIFDRKQMTVVFNGLKSEENKNLVYVKLSKEEPLISQVLQYCYNRNIQSIIVEGGSRLAQSFIDESLWDEARVIENTSLIINRGLPAPTLSGHKLITTNSVLTDSISCYKNAYLNSRFSNQTT